MSVHRRLFHRRLWGIVFVGVFPVAVAMAEELPATLEGLERYEAAYIAGKSGMDRQVGPGAVRDQFELQVWHTRLACIKALGHEEFCTCISENIPADQEFANYVVAVSKTKDELKFDQLSEYYQEVVDMARASRDLCVWETMR